MIKGNEFFKKTPAMIAFDKKIKLELDKKIIELLQDEKYYCWLNEFTKEMPIITDIEDLEINNSNIRNVQSIYVLYKMIDNYAKKKGISISKFKEKTGIYYSIINMGQTYEIGNAELNDKLVHFCCRCDKDSSKIFIDINDIRNEYYLKKQKELEELKELKKLVISLLDKGIESNDISTFVNEGIKIGKQRQIIKYYKNTD